MREYEFRCMKCGKVWYATDKDIRDSKKLKYSVGQTKIQRASLIHGEKYTRHSEKIAQMQMADRDPERCPNCGSRQAERTVDEIIESNSNSGGNRFLIGLVALFMPYLGFFLVLFKKPFSQKANRIWMVYCVVMTCIVFCVMSSKYTKQNDTESVIQQDADIIWSSPNLSNVEANENTVVLLTTMTDVQSWYDGMSGSVAIAFEEYLSNQIITVSSIEHKITNAKTSETKFMFGADDGWYDCHYVTYFTCKLGDMNCTGHARGFLEYLGDTVTWWSLEIDCNDIVLIDDYNEEYDAIIEDYYKELYNTYGIGGE